MKTKNYILNLKIFSFFQILLLILCSIHLSAQTNNNIAPICTGTPKAGEVIVTQIGCPSVNGPLLSLLNASSGPGITYQWYRNNIFMPGATNPTFQVSPLPLTALLQADFYNCGVYCATSNQWDWNDDVPVFNQILGASAARPIFIGQAPCANYYSNTMTNSSNCFMDSIVLVTNQPSPEIFYQFFLPKPATVRINHCGSVINTALHLLNIFGSEIAFNDDNGLECPGQQASIVMNLPSGSYTVISEGSGNTIGPIQTNIKIDPIVTYDTLQMTSLPCGSSFVWQTSQGGTGLTYTSTGVYTNTIPNAFCGNDVHVLNLEITPPGPTSLQIRCILEGYWDGNSAMLPVINNQLGIGTLTDCDTINVRIFAGSFLACGDIPVFDGNVVLQTNGMATVSLPSSLEPNVYLIAVNHRNTLETWSQPLIMLPCVANTYDFTTAASQAFGNNQIQLATPFGAPPIFGMLSGDVDQDCNIDLFDLTTVQAAIAIFASGYISEDINGDGIVDLLDESAILNNVINFTSCNVPPCQ